MTEASITAPATPAASQPVQAYTPGADEAALLALSREWMEIAARRPREEPQLARLRAIMAPEFTLQIWDGSRAALPREQWLRSKLAYRFEYDALSAQVFGDLGVVYSRFWWQGTNDGVPFFDAGFLADLWQRRDGFWQVVSRRSAPLEQVGRLRQRA